MAMLSALSATRLRHLCGMAAALPVAAALAWVGAAHAGQQTERFDVNITVTPVAQASSVCTTLKAPVGGDATVSVVCGADLPEASGRPVPGQQVARGDAYRVLTRREELAAGIDGYGGAIATTAVRVVNLPGRQYIEMTVGW